MLNIPKSVFKDIVYPDASNILLRSLPSILYKIVPIYLGLLKSIRL